MVDDLFLFVDRSDAGEQLADKLYDDPLIKETSKDELLVLSIPRGGVVVGAAIAQALQCPHDVVIARKIGFPGQRELAIGAMAEDGTVILSPYVTGWHELKDDYVKQKEEQVKTKIASHINKFRHGRSPDLQSKTVIVVDDGIATGETMKAAVVWMTSQEPSQRPNKVIVAAPICSLPAAREFAELADKLVCLSMPERFWAVGQFYWNFDQVDDEEVMKYLLPSSHLLPS